jgi:hypothetical protein
MNRDPVATQELLQRQVSLLRGSLEQCDSICETAALTGFSRLAGLHSG